MPGHDHQGVPVPPCRVVGRRLDLDLDLNGGFVDGAAERDLDRLDGGDIALAVDQVDVGGDRGLRAAPLQQCNLEAEDDQEPGRHRGHSQRRARQAPAEPGGPLTPG